MGVWENRLKRIEGRVGIGQGEHGKACRLFFSIDDEEKIKGYMKEKFGIDNFPNFDIGELVRV